MELLCNAPAHASVPDRYVFPPEKRAALQLDGVDGPDDGVTLPVVDLHRAALSGDDGLRRRVAEEIVRAGKEFGFFQARDELSLLELPSSDEIRVLVPVQGFIIQLVNHAAKQIGIFSKDNLFYCCFS
jgi:hypothetical protein